MPDGQLRLEAAPHFRPPSLADLGEHLRVVDLGRSQLASAYWDTADLRLARWGASLVFSEQGGWQVWRPTQGPRPEEPALSFEGGADAPPAGALEALQAYIRGSALTAVARVRRVRRTYAVTDAERRDVLRLMSDEISVLDGRRVAARYRQVILQPSPDADIGVVHAVLTRLRAAGAGGPDLADEHSRVLGPAAGEAPEIAVPALSSESSLLDVVRAMAGSSASRLLLHDAAVRTAEDPEAVHQARVATRRLRSDLDTFSPVLEGAPVRRLRAELKWLGGLLGEVRDADVLTARLARQIADLGPDAEANEGAALLARLSEAREQAQHRLMVALRGARYVRLLDALVEFSRQPQLRGNGERPAAAVLPGLAAEPWKQLVKTVDKLPRQPADEQLHAVRIAAKRARYAAEAAAPVIGPAAARLAAALAELQGTLGDFNDAVVARAWLVSSAPTLQPGSAFLAGALSERERSRGEAAVAQWKQAWRAAAKVKLHRWLTDD